MTIDRVGPSTDALLIDPGRIRLVFDGGPTLLEQGAREYVNAETIEWNPSENTPRTARFVCDAIGFTGNLDFLKNEETGLLDLDLIAIKDQDQARANVGGSILFGVQSILQDSGLPSIFQPEDVGLYVRIDDASNLTNVGKTRRIVGFEWPEVEIPDGSGRYPRRVFLEDVLRRNTVEVLQDDGGVFTDYDAQARNENGTNDVPVLPDPFVVGDALVISFTKTFQGCRIRLDTPGEGDWTVAWEYWNGVAWAALPDIDDATNGLRPETGEGEYEITWGVPLDWDLLASPTGSGLNLFSVRMRVTGIGVQTVVPVAGRVVLLSYEPLDGIVNVDEAVLEAPAAAFTDYTTEANDNALDDVPVMAAAAANGDSFMVAATTRFSKVDVLLTTPGEGTWTIVWEYYNDAAVWVPLGGVNDTTNGFRDGGQQMRSISFDVPDDWAEFVSPITANLRYFVRARVTAFAAIVTQPFATRVKVGALLDDGTVKWTLLDFQEDDLGLALESVEAFSGGRDDDLYVLGDNRGIYRQPGESDDVFRDRASRLADVVSPNAILRAINRIMRPLGYRGEACDVQFGGIGGGYTGLFLDIDADLAPDFLSALDLYAAGDLYPENQWLVLQSAQEAYGWFLVKLPYLGAGDFGIFLDEGPLYFDETVEVFYGPAMTGWMDGYPVDGYATYSAIYSAVDAIKAGGVGFTLVRREDLTEPQGC